jgi:orotate phosphoribosyltransferase
MVTVVPADGINQATMATSLPRCGQLMPGAGDDARVSNADLAPRVRERCRLTGRFVLRSGRVTDEYFDKYQFEADPALLDEIATAMAPLVPEATEVLAGLEMGGIAVVTALGQRTGLPCAFVRKAAKPYGTARLAEGADITGREVLVVEDVVTSGGQIAISAGHLRDLGAHVGHALCVIDRQEGGARLLAAAGIRLHALLKREDLDQA